MDRDQIRKEVDDLAERLGDLMQVDVDAVEAYKEAIEKIDSQQLKSQLSKFRDDHERHVTELTEALMNMGHKPPERKKDLKGTLIEGMTALRSSLGDEQALKAMRQNEVVTNHAYEDALHDHKWPGEPRRIIERGLADERRHLQYIEEQLSVPAGAGTRSSSSDERMY